MINSNIGKYKIIRLIGEGGMASVYEAEHEILGTKVAVKVLNPMLSANAQIRERFVNEAKMMASFNHPNITRIIDFDDQPQQLSIVMEYLDGEDLNEKIKRNGALHEKEVVSLFQQILSAFQYAHEKGVVHRDIKPSNIYILPNGNVKILDFGIAKLFGQGNEMTQTGTQMGTPIYMSPEQVKADKSIDHRSDIYSLGVTMFYAVNGAPPYDSDTHSQFDIFNKIVFEQLPDLVNHSHFDQFIKKACQKDREQRYQSCNEWMNALHSYSMDNDNNKLSVDGDLMSSKEMAAEETTPENSQSPKKPFSEHKKEQPANILTSNINMINQEVLRIERSVRDRNESDKVLMNYWLCFFLLQWVTLGIIRLVLFFQRIGRVDKFIRRKKSYFESLIKYCEQISKEKNKYNEVSTQINKLKDVYEYEFLLKNKTINAGLSFLLIILTIGLWGFVVRYKLNKAWDNLQRAEQKFYDELNPILTYLELTKYPINFRIKSNKSRSFVLYLFFSLITLGIWAIVWDYMIHTDADDLYPEFHTAEDYVLGAIKK